MASRFLLRHFLTDNNNAISDFGNEQAKTCAAILLEKGIKHIVYTENDRTKNSAEILKKIGDFELVPVQKDSFTFLSILETYDSFLFLSQEPVLKSLQKKYKLLPSGTKFFEGGLIQF